MSQRVFFSYARADQAFALSLAEHLKARGVPLWLDQWDISPEADWDRTIDQSLRDCARLLIVLSPASVDSREVRGELRTALDLGKPILPVLYQPCQIPRQLRVVQLVDFTGRSPDDERALDQVVRACEQAALGQPVAPLDPTGAVPTSSRRGGQPGRPLALSVRTKTVLAAALLLLLAGAAYFGLDMATEERRRLNDAALSPDGAYVAAATGQGIGVRGAVRVWDVGSGRETAFIPVDGPPWVCAWSPDGKKLAIGDHSGTIQIYDASTWRRAHALTGPRTFIRDIAWSPDNAAIATGDSSGSLWVWDAATGALRFSKPVQSDRIDAVTWRRDSSQLATGSADHSVAIVNARDGTVKRLQGHKSVVSTVAFSPDGEFLASGSLEAPFLIVWDSNGGRHDLSGHRMQVERVAWSADGNYLASAGKDNLVHVWIGRRFELLRRFNLTGQFNSGTSLAWSADGARLAAGDATGVQILDPDSNVPLHTLPERSGDALDTIEIAGWSADGKRLGTFTRQGRTSSVWDVDRATRLRTFRVGLWRSLTE